MKKVQLTCCVLIFATLTGCNLHTPDYYNIMLTCAKRGGYYFSATVPTWLGPRLVAGCAEDMSNLEVTVTNQTAIEHLETALENARSKK